MCLPEVQCHSDPWSLIWNLLFSFWKIIGPSFLWPQCSVSHHDVSWSAAGWVLSRLFNQETHALEFWIIFLNYFIANFPSLIFSVLSFWNFYYLANNPAEWILRRVPNLPIFNHCLFAFLSGVFSQHNLSISYWVFHFCYFISWFPKPRSFFSEFLLLIYLCEDVNGTFWEGFFWLHCLCFLCIVFVLHSVFHSRCLLKFSVILGCLIILKNGALGVYCLESLGMEVELANCLLHRMFIG